MAESTETTAGSRRRPAKHVSPEKRFYFPVPNIVLELGLTPYELALYCAIRRTTDESGRCFRSGDSLARLCGMSTGTVSAAKWKLARPFAMLGSKPLIRITLRPSRHGGKPCHHITPMDIWSENVRFFRPTPSPAEEPNEIATSPDDLATSSDETKNTPLRKIREEAPPSYSPSSRENTSEGRAEEISYFWRFVCQIFKRPLEREPSRSEIKLMKHWLPVPADEYELVEWWYGLSTKGCDYKEGIGFHLRRRPSSVRSLLRVWSSVNDVARGFRREFEEKGYLL
jgi:hypothetical protein